MEGKYPRTRGRQVYEIPDGLAYERYWIGRRPSSRALFEEWLRDPDASMFEVTRRHGKLSFSISTHTTAMNKLGILTRRKQDV